MHWWSSSGGRTGATVLNRGGSSAARKHFWSVAISCGSLSFGSPSWTGLPSDLIFGASDATTVCWSYNAGWFCSCGSSSLRSSG